MMLAGQPVRFTADVMDDGLSCYPPPIARAGMLGEYVEPVGLADLHVCTVRFDGVLFAVAPRGDQFEAV